jgi:hypothetical protein
MNTNCLPAFGTGPPCLFVSNETSHAELHYVLEIVNHTHTILGPIPVIQVVQHGAGKAITTEAVPDSPMHKFLTVLDSACDDGFRFDTVVTPATGASLLLSYVRAAQAAVHSAGSDQRRANRVCLCRSLGHHVCLLGVAHLGASVLRPYGRDQPGVLQKGTRKPRDCQRKYKKAREKSRALLSTYHITLSVRLSDWSGGATWALASLALSANLCTR